MMTKQAELKKQAYASSLKSRALSILIYLIDRSNKDLTCFPAIPTMAEQLHISVSTVKRALHELVDAGYIEKDARFRDKNRGQTSNLYTLLFVEQAPAPDNDNPTADRGSDSIDTPAAATETAQSHYQPTYLSFETIAQQNIVQEQPEEIPEREAEPTPSVTRNTPVHLEPLHKMIRHNLHTHARGLAVRCLSSLRPFSMWTGVESILIPP